MPKVFVLQEDRNKDISSARQFGNIIYLFEKFERNRPSIWETEKFQSELLNRLKYHGYNPRMDFVMLLGSQIMVAYLVAALAQQSAFKALAFDATTSHYVEIEL